MLARRLVQFTPPTRGCTRSRVQRGTWGCCWGPARTTRPPWPCPPAPRKGSRRCGTTCCCCGARWRSSARSWCPDPGPGAGHTTGGGASLGETGLAGRVVGPLVGGWRSIFSAEGHAAPAASQAPRPDGGPQRLCSPVMAARPTNWFGGGPPAHQGGLQGPGSFLLKDRL